LEQERDNIYSAWKGACAWEMESFRELESLKQTQGKVLSVEEMTEIVIIGVQFEILNDLTPYAWKEACKNIATAIHKAQKGE